MKAIALRDILHFSKVRRAAIMIFMTSLFLVPLAGTQAVHAQNGKDKMEAKEAKEEKKEKKKSVNKPNKTAKTSAKDAKRAMRAKQKAIQDRAKVRLFFHKMFNTKYGKPVNFRKRRARNRWKQGKRTWFR